MEENGKIKTKEEYEEDTKQLDERIKHIEQKYGIKEGEVPENVTHLTTEEVRSFLLNGVPEGFWEKYPEKYELWKDAGLDQITKEDLNKPPDWLEKVEKNPNLINEYSDLDDI